MVRVARAAEGRPAKLGGTPLHPGAFPGWPVFDAPEARRAFLGEAANLAGSGPPELVLGLREPLQPSGFFGPGAVRARVRFAVDDAEAFRRALGA